MADLNGGKGKFWGVDENVQYADSFVGATKVAEKVKKGGSETTSDGYVVDAIDIDWGGLKLTTISDNWSFGLQQVSSTEQNAGKGDRTQGIHSTAYLLDKISSSFTQIYNEIGKDTTQGLRRKIKEVDDKLSAMAKLTPGELKDITEAIAAINNELKDPGAAGTLVTILDTLEGFNKDTDNVKDYIDKQDQALLGTATDSATAYTVHGVRNYVDTTATNSLIGQEGDQTIETHYGVKFLSYYYTDDAIDHLIGSYTDVAASDTIWGAKNYAAGIQTDLLGKDGDLWPTQHTVYGVAKYADTLASSSYAAVEALEDRLIGNTADTTINTHWGVKNSLIGKSTDEQTADTIWGAKNYAVKTLRGSTGDSATYETIYGAKKYADEKFETLSNTAFKVSRIEEGGEGILVFSTVSSYAG